MADLNAKVATLQDNIRKAPSWNESQQYAYWLTGANTKNSALAQYDMQRTGYGRLFILQMPAFVKYLLPSESNNFKHMLEFGNVGIDGIQGYSVDFGSATGGYAGTSVEMPTNVKDDTNSITIKVYETQGSLIRTYLDFWITGTIDPYIGLSTYHGAREVGANSSSYQLMQANHTMEALYVSTDPTGEKPEYVCLLTNMFPKQSNHDHFNYDPGSHDLVQLSLDFTCNKYMSAQINFIGSVALGKFKILRNYMNFYSGYTAANVVEAMEDTSKIADWVDPSVTTSSADGTTNGRDLTSTYVSNADMANYYTYNAKNASYNNQG